MNDFLAEAKHLVDMARDCGTGHEVVINCANTAIACALIALVERIDKLTTDDGEYLGVVLRNQDF